MHKIKIDKLSGIIINVYHVFIYLFIWFQMYLFLTKF
jgi:hypothetical protein